MALYAHIFHESPVSIWGLSSRQRLERALMRAGVTDFIEDFESIPDQGSVLLIRGDYLYDDRIIKSLVEKTNVLLQAGQDGERVPVAANVPVNLAAQALEILTQKSKDNFLPGTRSEMPETLSSSYQHRLRKSDPPFVMPVTQENARELEQLLFASAYKGVTDLVTKWAWPRPARLCTKICSRYNIRPNHVTLMGLILVIIASVMFAYGLFGWGLLAGWTMTFLDTVDGKLARVTITSSRFGHLFDHIIDLVHPPVWYIFWGLGLELGQVNEQVLPLNIVLWVIVGGYVVGRFVEATFTLCFGSFGIFCWHPIDSYFRLITARRNPNLILLTAGTLLGRPDAGLWGVAFWTGLTSLFLLFRLGLALVIRITEGPLRSWLLDIDHDVYDGSLAVKLFSRRTTAQSEDTHE